MGSSISVIDIINMILNIINTLFVLIPAILIFLYYKIHIIDMYFTKINESGMIISIHNITSKTLFISKCNLTSNNVSTDIFKDKFLEIKSDEIYKIQVDYKLLNINPSNNMNLEIIIKHRKIRKKIK